MNCKYFIMLMGLFLLVTTLYIPQANALLGTYKQGQEVNVITILNGTAVVNLTIYYPNNSIAINDLMTKQGSRFNRTFINTGTLGTYNYDYFDDNGNVYVNDFEVTPSGFGNFGAGAGLSIVGFLLIIILVGVVFLVVGFKVDNIVGKIAGFSLAIISFMTAVLFMLVSIQQSLYGFTGLVSGAETFWFVMKSLMSIGLVALFIIVGLVMYKSWKIKRGYVDED